MNLNVSLVDQRLEKIKEEIRQQAYDDLKVKDGEKLKSLSFVYLCVKT